MERYQDAVNVFGDHAIYEKVYTEPRPAAAVPVKLPKSERLDGNGYGYYFDMNDVFVALDTAGVEYQVAGAEVKS